MTTVVTVVDQITDVYVNTNVITVETNGGFPQGNSLPPDGTTGQVLTKLSDMNYDVTWQTPAAVGVYEIFFSYGDATPELITTLPAGSTVQNVSIIIFTAFNGTGATLSVGSAAGSYIDLMDTSEVFAEYIGTWSAYPAKNYVAATPVYIAITPGAGASAGHGQVIITLA